MLKPKQVTITQTMLESLYLVIKTGTITPSIKEAAFHVVLSILGFNEHEIKEVLVEMTQRFG